MAGMIQLVKGEFERFLNKKYILAMTILLVVLNLYIVNYEYDNYLTFRHFEENVSDAIVVVEGEITEEKTRLVEQKLQSIEAERDQATSEKEGHELNVKRFLYSDYMDYVEYSPFPLQYKDKVFENRLDLINELQNYEVANQTNSSAYIELSDYLDLVGKINKDSFYIMGWDYIFQQNILLFLMVIIIISMASVFGEDHSSNVASLTLSSKHGKTKLIKARVIASTLFGTILMTIFFVAELFTKLWLHGANGYQGRVSLLNFIYMPNQTPIALLFVFFFFTLFAALCLSLFTLAVSLIVKKTLNTMLVMVIIIMIAETARIPFISNLSLRNIVNSFYNSFIDYSPVNILGNLLHYPFFLVLWLTLTAGLSITVILYKGRRQQI